MEVQNDIKKVSVSKLLISSWGYVKRHAIMMVLFSLINYILLAVAVYLLGGWSHPAFLLLLVVMYLFWSYFFRFYFQRKPYILMKPIVRSLIPSSKIIFITIAFFTLIAWLPFAPLFLGVADADTYMPYIDNYIVFLQKYMQESHLLNWALNLPMVLVMPVILYRPFLAWIAALMGRKGSLRIAWQKTKHNYWQFVLLALVMNVPLTLLYELSLFSIWLQVLSLLAASPLLVYFNVVIAQLYEFFYND